jgi:hypothetical protein
MVPSGGEADIKLGFSFSLKIILTDFLLYIRFELILIKRFTQFSL